MLNLNRKVLAIAVAAVSAATLSTGVLAETQWQKNHPARTEVNHRLGNQNRRIHDEVREGEMTHARAAALHREDRQIRQEERNMASQNHGHLTAAESRAMNQQENAVSRQIGR